MKEILAKLNDLIASLDKKIVENDALAKKLSVELDIAKSSTAKNIVREAELTAREKSVGAVEDVIKVAEESKARLHDIGKAKTDNVKLLEQLAVERKKVDERNSELDKLMVLYRAKNESLEAEKVQLAKDRKEMRVSIIEELKKLK